MSVNSTSSIERFTLGAGKSRSFVNTDPGGNLWDVDVNGELVQLMDGSLQASNTALVKLQTAEDTAAVAASKVFYTTNTLTLTAVTAGVAGNAISFEVVNTGGTVSAGIVTVKGTTIAYTPVQAAGTITGTLAQAAAALAANAAAAALVTAAAGGTTSTALTAVAATLLTGGVDATVGSWSDVDSGTVIANGYDIIAGSTGKYTRIINVAGPGVVHVVAKPHRRVQPLVSLGA